MSCPVIAIVVGVSKYTHSGFEDLPAAQFDAKLFARCLFYWGVEEENLHLLLDEKATERGVSTLLDQLALRTEPFKLLLYYCGHGYRSPPPHPSSYLILFQSVLHLDSLLQKIGKLDTTETYLFIDACHLRINTLINPELEREIESRENSRKGLFCLLSSGVDRSYEDIEEDYGYFTAALIQGLDLIKEGNRSPSLLVETIHQYLAERELPVPEMYNIGIHHIDFFSTNWSPQSRDLFLGEIQKKMIRSKRAVISIVGEPGIGKSAVAKQLAPKACHALYFDHIPPIDSIPTHSLVVIDAELPKEHLPLNTLLKELLEKKGHYILVQKDPFSHLLSPHLKERLQEFRVPPMSLEETRRFVLQLAQEEKRYKLLFFSGRGNPKKIRRILIDQKGQLAKSDWIQSIRYFFKMQLHNALCLWEKLISKEQKKGALFWKRAAPLGILIIFPTILSISSPKKPTGGKSYPTLHPDFVGREEILHQLKGELLKPKKELPSSMVLWGEGGIGKTETAIAFASQNHSRFSLLYWINAGSTEVYQQSYYNLADALGIVKGQGTPFEIVRDRVHFALENQKSSRPWLLIYDNADLSVPIPAHGHGSILITTRDRGSWENIPSIQMPLLTVAEAKMLFSKLMQKPLNEDWLEIAEKLDYFPLALNQALNYVKQSPNLTLSEYKRALAENKTEIFQYAIASSRYSNHLLAMWQTSIEVFRSKYADAHEWLELCAYLHPDQIPTKWLEKWLMEKDSLSEEMAKLKANQILLCLLNQGYIRLNREKKTLSIHRIKQKLIKEGVKDGAQRALSLLTNHVEEFAFHDTLEWDGDGLEKLSDWYANATWWLASHETPSVNQREVALLCNVIGNFNLVFRGKYQEAMDLYKRAIALNTNLDTLDNPSHLITSLLNEANCLFFMNEYELSHEKLAQIGEYIHSVYGDLATHHLARYLVNKGSVLNHQFRHREAVDYFQQALDIQDRLYESRVNAETCETLKWLGGSWDFLDGTKSLNYTLEALKINKKLFGEKHNIQRLYILSNLGGNYRKLGRLDEALNCHLEALEMGKGFISDNSDLTITHLRFAASIYRQKNQRRKAIAYGKQSLHHAKTLKREGNPIPYLESLCTLGWNYLYVDEIKSIKLFNKILKYLEKQSINRKDLYYLTYYGIGKAYYNINQFEKSIAYLEKSMVLCRALRLEETKDGLALSKYLDNVYKKKKKIAF